MCEGLVNQYFRTSILPVRMGRKNTTAMIINFYFNKKNRMWKLFGCPKSLLSFHWWLYPTSCIWEMLLLKFLPGESMDRGAWRVTVHTAAKSRTWLKRLSMLAKRQSIRREKKKAGGEKNKRNGVNDREKSKSVQVSDPWSPWGWLHYWTSQ